MTLFGIVDAGISNYTNKSTLIVNPLTAMNNPLAYWGVPGSAKKSWTGMTTSGTSSSQLGFRGVEDLGGGLSASFWLEAAIRNDDGTVGVTAFNRRSTVSLAGGFGEIRLGRDYKPTFSNNSAFDPFGTVGVGTNLIQKAAGGFGGGTRTEQVGLAAPTVIQFAGDLDNVRTSNAIGYFLPGNLGGFYGNVQYAFHEKPKYDNGTFTPAGGDTRSGRYWGGRFGYANGPLNVAVAYGEQNSSSAFHPGFDNNVKTFNAGASYDLGVVKLFGEYARLKSKAEYSNVALTDAFTTTNRKLDGYHIGLTAPVGAGVIKASYGQVKTKQSLSHYGLQPALNLNALWAQALNPTPDEKAQQIAVGYVHNLSKRTALYGTVAYIKNKNGAGYSVGAIAAAAQGGNWIGGAVPNVYQPKTSIGYDIGIRHSF